MTIEIEINEIMASNKIDFSPGSELEEIIQNVRTIVTTPIYTVPLDRMFGLDAELVDLPIPVLQAKLTSKIVTAVQKFEPRVLVTGVSYSGDAMDGTLRPTVRFRIKER